MESGIKGIGWHKKANKWRVRVERNGVIYSALAETLEEAEGKLNDFKKILPPKVRNENYLSRPDWFTHEWYKSQKELGNKEWQIAMKAEIPGHTLLKWKKDLVAETGIPFEKRRKVRKGRAVPCEYALYKGEDFLFMGTKRKCAEFLNVKPETIYYYSTPAHLKRVENRKNAIVAVCSDDNEDEII